jgi:archaellum biogenesis protein FlaJ (TadC family)
MNRAFYVVIPVATSFFGTFCMLVPMYYSIAAPREMTVRTYRYVSASLVSVCMVVMIFYALTAAAALFHLIAAREEPLAAAQVLSFLAYLAGSAALFGLWRMEKTSRYITLPPRHAPPDKSDPIKYESSF